MIYEKQQKLSEINCNKVKSWHYNCIQPRRNTTLLAGVVARKGYKTLTMADEGVIVLEKICSLKNSVKLKLALICGQTCHHIWKRLILVLAVGQWEAERAGILIKIN